MPTLFSHTSPLSPRALGAAFALVLLALAPAAQAGLFSLPRSGTATQSHNLRAGPGVFRLTLSGLNRFLVVKTGDRKGTAGELRRITITLYNRSTDVSEVDTVTLTQDLLRNASATKYRNSYGNSAYLKIHKGDFLEPGGPRGPRPATDMWINVRPGDRIRLGLKFRELDCSGERVCNRGDNGRYELDMVVPATASAFSSLCAPTANSWSIGRQAQYYVFRGMPTTTITAKGSVLLYPLAGRICITPSR